MLPHAGTPQKAAARKHPQFVSGLSNRQSIWFKVGEFFFFVIRTCPVILTHRGHDISVFRSSCQARIGRDHNLATEPSQRVSSSSSRISRIVSTLMSFLHLPSYQSLGHQHPLPLPGTVRVSLTSKVAYRGARATRRKLDTHIM